VLGFESLLKSCNKEKGIREKKMKKREEEVAKRVNDRVRRKVNKKERSWA